MQVAHNLQPRSTAAPASANQSQTARTSETSPQASAALQQQQQPAQHVQSQQVAHAQLDTAQQQSRRPSAANVQDLAGATSAALVPVDQESMPLPVQCGNIQAQFDFSLYKLNPRGKCCSYIMQDGTRWTGTGGELERAGGKGNAKKWRNSIKTSSTSSGSQKMVSLSKWHKQHDSK